MNTQVGLLICMVAINEICCETYTQFDKQIQKKRRSAISTGENSGIH